MKIVNFTRELAINSDSIVSILYPNSHSDDNSCKTIQATVEQAKKDECYYDFTNHAGDINSYITLLSGSVYATSLTKEKINRILSEEEEDSKRRNILLGKGRTPSRENEE